MARKTIQAAGGIVVRGGARPRIAVVQRSKDERWVLPRGKLERGENPARGARREVVEETGHRVKVHEFLGAIIYRARGRRRLAAGVRRWSYPLEKLFLRHVGRRILKQRGRKTARRKTIRKSAKARKRRPSSTKKTAARHKAKARAKAKARPAETTGTHRLMLQRVLGRISR